VTKLGSESPQTEIGPVRACQWCRRPVQQPKVGRPRKFCKRSCRQRDFEARTKAAAHGLDEHELVMTRSELESLKDQLYVLRCAVEDVERDRSAAGADGLSTRELAESLAWLLDAAKPLSQALST
jgi:hypothetical protein